MTSHQEKQAIASELLWLIDKGWSVTTRYNIHPGTLIEMTAEKQGKMKIRSLATSVSEAAKGLREKITEDERTPIFPGAIHGSYEVMYEVGGPWYAIDVHNVIVDGNGKPIGINLVGGEHINYDRVWMLRKN